MMSRKHYRQIAHAISRVPSGDPYPWTTLAKLLTPILEADNESFDGQLFLEACTTGSVEDSPLETLRKHNARQLARGAEPVVGQPAQPVFVSVVQVEADTLEQAVQVLGERLGCDEDYGFDYRVTYTSPVAG